VNGQQRAEGRLRRSCRKFSRKRRMLNCAPMAPKQHTKSGYTVGEAGKGSCVARLRNTASSRSSNCQEPHSRHKVSSR
jgi:hypothetical protein